MSDLIGGLSFTQGDQRWRALRERALRDLYFFNATVLGFADVFPLLEETHAPLLAFMARATGEPELDDAPMQINLWPRETGKTTCGTVGKAIWRAVKNPNTGILIVNEKRENAQDFLKSIKWQFESNELLRALFPEVIPDDFQREWSSERATLRRNSGRPEPTFDTIGVGGTVVGKHFDHLILDDLIGKEAVDNAKSGSWSVMESVNFWLRTLRPLLSHGAEPFGTIDINATRWFAGDSYEYAMKLFSHGEEPRRYLVKARLRNGTVVVREAWRAGDIAVMQVPAHEQGRAVFPAIWPLDTLQKMQWEDPETYAVFMQNDPTESAITTFKAEWIASSYWEWIDRHLVTYRTDDGLARHVFVRDLLKTMMLDPAFTTRPDSDRSAIIVLGTDPETGKRLVLDAIALKADQDTLVDQVLTTAKTWGVGTLHVESAGQQAALLAYLTAAARAKNQPLNVEPAKPGGRNKDVRIEALQPYFKSRTVLLHRSQLDLLEEYRKYRPGTKYYRDLLDALAYAVELAPAMSLRGHGTSAAERAKSGLDAYRARRAGIRPAPRSTSVSVL